MAIIEQEPSEILELESGAASPTRDRGIGILARPTANTGWRSWLFTVDHKKLGILYGAVAMFWFLIAGIEALLVRLQLAVPNGTVLTADEYNQLFTMHGTTMVFLVVMPLAAAFANYVVPLQIGARDVAFPRMNALGLWLFVFGGIFLNLSWFTGGGAWDASVRGIYELPAKIRAVDIGKAVALSLSLSFLVTIFPAARAARMNPVEALRYE